MGARKIRRSKISFRLCKKVDYRKCGFCSSNMWIIYSYDRNYWRCGIYFCIFIVAKFMKYIIWSIIGLVGLCILYYSINPATSHLMPKCPFRLLTGFDCPACGIQRAFYNILHCDFGTAIRYNYFLVISVPYFIAVFITTFCKNQYVQIVRVYIQHPITVWVVLALTIIWWIVRNIPIIQTSYNML